MFIILGIRIVLSFPPFNPHIEFFKCYYYFQCQCFVLSRLAPLLALLSLFDINRVLALHQQMFNVKFRQDKALYGHSLVNITNTNMEECMGKCLENCLCQSFQLCNEIECQLCSSKHELIPSALRERQGCMYYDFESDLSEVSEE